MLTLISHTCLMSDVWRLMSAVWRLMHGVWHLFLFLILLYHIEVSSAPTKTKYNEIVLFFLGAPRPGMAIRSKPGMAGPGRAS